ncbi:coenzyme F420 hydrogenase, subunit gamma [Methanocaldococcus villosus KIN24-T80]|uniref:Coenzyme F420 hydrogenase subunit gamma n=1 Tax=Methanocaldococcus villosus KIN24-T80 TaxID=1069083 RepID=N6V1J3_9EURY|nr:coenzyme F420 hydrogenase subunit gamma [Methanocaldococcus villosus]ENN96143.1 coenzyme F420 hydrogenase, subunit gamma [Methanocaldococcus villosus KIN24-T80]
MVKIAHVQLCSCCGCLVSLTDLYERLLEVLDKVELVYSQTLMDVREIPECDIAIVEGAVCLDDHHSLEVAKEVRERAKIVIALGSCAVTGGITRFCKGNQKPKPVHNAFTPLSEVINVDLSIPGCPPSPDIIYNVILALLNNDVDYLSLFVDKKTKACGCDLITEVVNKDLCMGCGTCAASCPTRAIEMIDGRPVIKETCIKCGVCSFQCPRIRYPKFLENIEGE